MPRSAARSEADRRLRRLQSLTWVLDRSIPIGKWRIGLDPILGLLPGIGDWIGALVSLYIVYEGGRLGVPAPVLTRMGGNILVEAIVGVVPLFGDVFDFAWQANTRNLALIERHYQPALEPRSMRKLWLTLAVICFVVVAVIVGLAVLMVNLVAALFR